MTTQPTAPTVLPNDAPIWDVAKACTEFRVRARDLASAMVHARRDGVITYCPSASGAGVQVDWDPVARVYTLQQWFTPGENDSGPS